MQWIEPLGYSSWRYKKSKYAISNKLILLCLCVLIISFYSLFYWDLGQYYPEFDRLDFYVFFISINILLYPLYHWLNSIFNFHQNHVVILDTCIHRCLQDKRQRADIYLNEIKSIKFERISWKGYEFYNCHIILKPLRASRKGYFHFGVGVDFYEKNTEVINQNLRNVASFQASMSAPVGD